MQTDSLLLEVVDRRIEWYEDKLIAESKIAQLCGDFEETLCGFAELFRLICELNEVWREDVFSAITPYSPDFDAKVKAVFERWLACDGKIQNLLVFFEGHGYEGGVKGASEYRRFVKVARKTVAEWTSPQVATALGFHAIVMNKDESKALRSILAG